MKLDIKGLVILAVIAGVLAFFWFAPGSGLQTAPNVSFKTIDGKSITLSELKGKPYILTFWATDCPGCVAEIPHLVDLYKEYAGQGLRIIAIAMPHDDLDAINTMRRLKGMSYDIAFDRTGELTQAFGNVMVTPTSYLVTPEGKIALQKIGEMDMKAVEHQIATMLKKS